MNIMQTQTHNLTFADFKTIMLDEDRGYKSYKNDKIEICLEPCENGCDVGVYDLSGELLEEKYCTNIIMKNNITDVVAIRTEAFFKFNELYNKYGK